MLKIAHVDMNFKAFRGEMLRLWLKQLAEAGFCAVLWEVEDQVCWETCPEAVSPDAMTKNEFRSLLEYSRNLNLEPIPLLQTIGHGEYVLKSPRRLKFREQPGQYDCYCTSSPEVRSFMKQWIREYFDLFGSLRYFHLGGDEAYVFGTCPECRKYPRNELYGNYISDLGREVIRRGARPAVWGDMILQEQDNLNPISKDFVIWDWKYTAGFEPDAFASTDLLRREGFDVVLCSAAQSSGDDPFLIRYPFHFENIAACAFRTRSQPSLLGNCLTSWSIRLAPKFLQMPLMEAGVDALEGVFTQENRADYFSERMEKYTGGADPETIMRVTSWYGGLNSFTAVQWTGFKDSLPAESGYFKSRLQLFHQEKCFEELLENTQKLSEELQSGIAVLERLPHLSVFGGKLLTGAKWKFRLLKLFYAAFSGEEAAPAMIAEAIDLREEIQRWYAAEETDASAAKNAALVMDPLLEYFASSRIDVFSVK